MKKHSVSILTAVMLMLLAAATAFNITFFSAADYYNARLENLEEQEARYSKLKSVADIVEKYFVADYSEADAIESALSGYVDGLGDQWSAYYTAEETAAIEEDSANLYVGIGVTYSLEEEHLFEITLVNPGGPAEQAGIQLGDVILRVDGVEVSTLDDPQSLVQLVKGEKGTQVELTLDRDGETVTVTVTRDEIRTYSVTSTMLEGQLGYIKIADFDANVDKEFEQHLDQLLAEGAQGFLFDVRFNPGGYLSVLRAILDRLLPEGIVITTVDKQGNETPYTSDADWIQLPMVVLTNENSISAAEFFAAALQEYEVATVVGTPTSGKGYSQQTFMLSDGSSVHISTTRYYTPKGNSLADTGVTPDISVALDDEALYLLYAGKLEQENDAQLQAGISALQTLLEEQAAQQAPDPAEETDEPAAPDTGETQQP